MLPPMAAKAKAKPKKTAGRPIITIVGPGRLGTALALALRKAGYRISEIVARNNAQSMRRARDLAKKVGALAANDDAAVLNANLVWFCVPDRDIAAVARGLASRTNWKSHTAFHSSGALPSDELQVLRKQGAAVASVHPLMTFVRGAIPSLQGVPFAIEGDAAAARLARRIAQDLGGAGFTIRKQHKAAYHAWGAFTSPLLVSLLVTGEQVARAAGLSVAEARQKMLPIVRQTLANYAKLGPAGAFSGPLVRGDAEIVRKHLRTLKDVPAATEVYLALAKSALRYLPVRQRTELKKALAVVAIRNADSSLRPRLRQP